MKPAFLCIVAWCFVLFLCRNVAASGTVVVEAEDLDLTAGEYSEEDNAAACNGKSLKTDSSGEVTYRFQSDTGQYNLIVHYFDESDGESNFTVYVADDLVDQWTADDNNATSSDESSPILSTLRSRTLHNLRIRTGDRIRIQGERSRGERARLDLLEIVPASQPDDGSLPILGHTAGAEQSGHEAAQSYDGNEQTRWANKGTLASA